VAGELLQVDHRAPSAAVAEALGIIGADTGLARVLEQVHQVADRPTAVLLRGETGTGKELIARVLHLLSHRRHRPFVVANCAAIPHELLESEAFGHVRGAFTGAVSDHAGWFESADAGTLLLDEVGDLHLDLQAKILRVLEDGGFRRVGASRTQRNRARIVASTHQPLERWIEEGRFREDLYYRLLVYPIELPPLRERREDIPALACHFLRSFGESHGRTGPRLSPSALALLVRQEWPGNVRELRNCMERLVLTCPRPVCEERDLLPLLCRRTANGNGGVEPLKDVERRAIEEALLRCGGNRTHAAKALGIGRRTLQNKLKAFGHDGEG
jgi:transcriptional regulator with GAF, ATPase, and Fis domain